MTEGHHQQPHHRGGAMGGIRPLMRRDAMAAAAAAAVLGSVAYGALSRTLGWGQGEEQSTSGRRAREEFSADEDTRGNYGARDIRSKFRAAEEVFGLSGNARSNVTSSSNAAEEEDGPAARRHRRFDEAATRAGESLGLHCDELLKLARERQCRRLIGRMAIASRREASLVDREYGPSTWPPQSSSSPTPTIHLRSRVDRAVADNGGDDKYASPSSRSTLLFDVLHGCRDAMGRTAVHIAAANGDAELIAHIVEFGGGKEVQRNAADASTTCAPGPSHRKAADDVGGGESSDTPVLDPMVIRRGMLVNARDLHGLTPLEYAAWRGKTGALDMLLQYRASCRLCDNFGLTALHKSVGHNNHTATLRLLSDGGCDVNIESSDVASSNAHAHSGSASNEEDYAYIVKTNNKRQTPLHVACKREEFGRYAPADESMVAMLLRWGGDPNRYDADNCTPLHYAARSGDTNTIRLLLKYGADVTLRGGGREESALPFDLLPEGCSPVALELLSGARVVRR